MRWHHPHTHTHAVFWNSSTGRWTLDLWPEDEHSWLFFPKGHEAESTPLSFIAQFHWRSYHSVLPLSLSLPRSLRLSAFSWWRAAVRATVTGNRLTVGRATCNHMRKKDSSPHRSAVGASRIRSECSSSGSIFLSGIFQMTFNPEKWLISAS